MNLIRKKLTKPAIILIVLAASATGGVFISGYKNAKLTDVALPPINYSVDNSEKEQPAQKVPFEELTIPYLREVNFESNLGERTVLSSAASYTSYLTYYISEGLRVNGLLTIPSGEMPEGGWPAIVFVHGYIPPTQYQTTQNYVSYVDFLAKNGFVVFKIDLRGHGSSEGEATGSYYSSDYIADTLNAYSALGKASFVNKNRIGLWGHSMGGNTAFRSFVVKRNMPAVVIWAGAVYTYEDFAKYSIDDNSYRPPKDASERRRYRELLFETYGSFDPDSEFWKQVVPTNYLEGVSGAVQVHHAVDDPVVNIGYSRDLMAILDKTGIKHSLREHATGGHNISGGSFNRAMQETVEFFRIHL